MIAMAEDIQLLRELFASSSAVSSAMRRTLDFCGSKYRVPGIQALYDLPFEQGTGALQNWVQTILRTEPPPGSIKAYYFGLFEIGGKEQMERPCLHICGCEQFDGEEQDQDWACSPTWRPKGRYANSDVLAALEDAARHSEEHRIELSYLLQLTFAGAAISHVMHSLPKDLTLGDNVTRALAIGFDSGDLFLLPAIQRSPV